MFAVQDLKLTILEEPRGDRLFVLPLISARGGLIIDMEANRERPERGIVVAVSQGDGVAPETGRPIAVLSKVGDLVKFGKYAGLSDELEGPKGPVKSFIMRDVEVLSSLGAGRFDITMHDDDPSKIHLAGLTCEHCETVQGEEGLSRLRDLAAGRDPDAGDAAMEEEKARASGIILP